MGNVYICIMLEYVVSGDKRTGDLSLAYFLLGFALELKPVKIVLSVVLDVG